MNLDVKDLNDDQTEIYNRVMEIMPKKRPSQWDKMSQPLIYEVIQGVAGSGKTTLTSLLVRDLIARGLRVFCTAPTHKASQELERQYGNAAEIVENSAPIFGLDNVSSNDGPDFCGTIHSALGLKPVGDDEKRTLKVTDFRRTTTAVGDKSGYSLCDVLFLDEGSMVGHLLEHHALERQGIDRFHIIVVGDSYQLDPVEDKDEESTDKSTKRSPVFDRGNESFKLNNVTRQAENSPIIQLSALCRDNIDHVMDTELFPKPDGRVMQFVDHDTIHSMSNTKLVENYMQLINNDAYNALDNRILTFTNERVDFYNYLIRQEIHRERLEAGEDILDYEAGEIVILQASIKDEPFSNSQEVLINECVSDNVKILAPVEFNGGTMLRYEEKSFDCYTMTISHITKDEQCQIQVIKADQMKSFTLWMWEKAKLFKKIKADNRAGSKAGWGWFWETMESFPSLKYSFASTIHKAQGSTFDNAIVDMNGIKDCMQYNQLLAWKLLYVGVTRPRHNLYLGVGEV